MIQFQIDIIVFMVYYLMVFFLLDVVIAVPDGLKAWETLKKKAPELDLILTEVELPAISGFALLSLIMEHDICKNIPVISMLTLCICILSLDVRSKWLMNSCLFSWVCSDVFS